jgi:putative nucleotidyltransferase with HDIG domain
VCSRSDSADHWFGLEALVAAKGESILHPGCVMRTKTFVQLICLCALVNTALLWHLYPAVGLASTSTLATLAALALTAELMGFLLPRGAKGSISFIPYVTTLLLVPNASALVAIVGAGAIAELSRQRNLQKFLFNCAQQALTYGLAITAYRLLGGVSLFDLQDLSVAKATIAVGLPMTVAYLLVFAMNGMLVCQVIALSSKSRFLQVWRDNHIATIGLDVLAIPLVFAFAWIYAKFGPMIASVLWLPILGLRQLNTTNIELQQTNRELLELMVKSIEARDPYTSGHSRRVKEYAVQIARLMGYDATTVEKIGTAALLHDVGKIYDKYAPILSKESRLTSEEWAVIKEHPVDGANLIATMTRLRELVPAVRHHHENWDGTGYPEGLKGMEIPLASRVIMFADTIDAMTTVRPYRGPLKEADVRSEIVRCRGKQFDPEVADRLLTSDFWRSLFPPTERRTPTPRFLSLISNASGS